MSKVEINLDSTRGKMVVNGIDISNMVTGFKLTNNACEFPKLEIELVPIELIMKCDAKIELHNQLLSELEKEEQAND